MKRACFPTETALHSVKWKRRTQPPRRSGHGGTVSLEVTVILIACDKSSGSTERRSAQLFLLSAGCRCGNSPSPSSASSQCRERPITATKNILHPVYPISQRRCSVVPTQPVPWLTLPAGQASAVAVRAAFLTPPRSIPVWQSHMPPRKAPILAVDLTYSP